MLQLAYISSLRVKGEDHTGAILTTSRHNNARDGVTGILYTDGRCFVQVLEGEQPAVETAFIRIINDTRHHAIILLVHRHIEGREFGSWSMAARDTGTDMPVFIGQVEALLDRASPTIKGLFAGLLAIDRLR